MTDAEFAREIAQPLAGETRDYAALLQLIGDARFVLIDEACHIDETRAVEPLEQTSIWEEGELPETYRFTV